MSSALHTVH